MRARGFVLATVLFTLLLLGAVITGAWIAAFQSVKSARQAQGEVQLRLRAASAIAATWAEWNSAAFDSLSIGNSIVRPGGGAIIESLTVRRVGQAIFAIRASAADTVAAIERALLAFGRADPLELRPRAAARVRDDPVPMLAMRISGVDSAPAGWACPIPVDTVASLLIQSSSTDSSFWRFGRSWDWVRLASWSAAAAGTGDSLPWLFHAGDLVLENRRFTGVIIADGNVTLRQSTVIGLVIARGAIRFEWLGGAILGGVVADRIELSTATQPANVRLAYSSCAADLAGRSRAPVRPIPGVPPADVY